MPISLPKDILIHIFMFIHLTQRFRAGQVSRLWHLAFLSSLKRPPFTLVVSQRRGQGELEFPPDYHNFAGLYSALNIPLKGLLERRTLYCYFNELTELNVLGERLSNITRLVIHSTKSGEIVGILKHLLDIYEKNDKLKSVKLIQDKLDKNEMPAIWQLLSEQKRELSHLSLGTSSSVDMTDSDTVMGKLVSFNYANLGEEEIDVFAILRKLSDEKCQSIGIHLCEENLDPVVWARRQGRNVAAQGIRVHIEQLWKRRRALWLCITQITEMNIKLVINLPRQPAIMEPLNMSSLHYLQVGLMRVDSLYHYFDKITECPNVTHLVLKVLGNLSIEHMEGEPFDFVPTIREMKPNYPKKRSFSVQHLTLIVELEIGHRDYFEQTNCHAEVMALFPNLLTLNTLCCYQGKAFELRLISNGKWFRDN